jgi:hypothetical protein
MTNWPRQFLVITKGRLGLQKCSRQASEPSLEGGRVTEPIAPAELPAPVNLEKGRPTASRLLRELVALPPAFESSCALALALSFRRRSTCRLDRIGGRTELVRGDVCDGRGLAGSVCGAAALRSLATAFAWPAAVRAWLMVISPRTQARASSIA